MAPLNFSVHISEPELVRPETPTPREFKYLSNIDDQAGLRNHIPFVHFYTRNVTATDDPVPAIRLGLSKALVHYYPLAGRLRNAEKGKLVVECCGEGVIFREADADVTLGKLRETRHGLKPPFLHWDRFLIDDIWGSFLVIDSPLLRVQVTRLSCGGFVLAYTFNHCACDAYGALQFVTAVSEFCRNPDRKTPSTIPAWGRETLKPRSPPQVSYPHPEYHDTDIHPNETPATETHFKRLAQTSTFFSRADISALKNQINGPQCPTFDAIASCLWRARTRILNLQNDSKLLFPIDTRFRYRPSLPEGYYGSAVVFPCAVAVADHLRDRPLRYAAKLVSEVKKGVIGDEYRASVLDFIEVNGRRGFSKEGAFVVSDMSRLRFADVDFGWGPAIYGGPARAGTGLVPGMVTSIVGHRNEEGVDGILALVSLPGEAVERFQWEVREEIQSGLEDFSAGLAHVVALSAL